MIVPVLSGRLRGAWWHLGSRGKLLRVLGGSYEREQTRLFESTVRPGQTVLDVGAHVGYYTLLAAALAGPRGAVWAFEPDPRNARSLRRHVRLNRLRHVHVEEAAVSSREGTARFGPGSGSGTGRLAGSGRFEVRTVSLDAFCAEREIRPHVVKIDVEGAERDVLAGARRVLERDRPAIFLSTHGPEVHAACLELLRGAGYAFTPVLGGEVQSAPELLCTPGGA